MPTEPITVEPEMNLIQGAELKPCVGVTLLYNAVGFSHLPMIVTGVNESLDLAEIIEIPDHPWFVAVQYHPEFKSRPTQAHPLFASFVRAALSHAGDRKAQPAPPAQPATPVRS